MVSDLREGGVRAYTRDYSRFLGLDSWERKLDQSAAAGQPDFECRE